MIIFDGDEAHLNQDGVTPAKVNIGELAQRISEATIHGLDDFPLPEHVRWLVTCGQVKVCIFEMSPEVRWIHWIAPDSPAPYGPEATTQPRQLATPFVVVKVPFLRERLVGRIELFYRNEPLAACDGPGGELFFPNLLNISPRSHGCVSWCCTQFVNFAQVPAGIAEGLHFVANFIFSGKLNLSSEAHEGHSGFSLTREAAVDPRVTDVNRWESASREDPRFITDIPWVPTGVTVRELVERELASFKVRKAPTTAAELGNLMLRRRKKK
jgi:hypothetical protein